MKLRNLQKHCMAAVGQTGDRGVGLRVKGKEVKKGIGEMGQVASWVLSRSGLPTALGLGRGSPGT